MWKCEDVKMVERAWAESENAIQADDWDLIILFDHSGW
jgi:hypothetical protein